MRAKRKSYFGFYMNHMFLLLFIYLFIIIRNETPFTIFIITLIWKLQGIHLLMEFGRAGKLDRKR